MKNPKVGERVRVYIGINTVTGAIACIKDSGMLEVKLDSDSYTWRAHHKQCRRLKPKKKPREWWINFEPRVGIEISTVCPENTDGWVHVKEVLK